MENEDIKLQLDALQSQLTKLQDTMGYKSSDARLRAEKKYYKKLTPFSLRFKKNEIDLWEYISKQPNKSMYIKKLVAQDMGYKNWAHHAGFAPTSQLGRQWDEERIEYFTCKLDKTNHTWEDLKSYIEDNRITKDEWEQIEKLFFFEDVVSEVACEALSKGALPYAAWTKEILTGRIEYTYELVDVDFHPNWGNISEDALKQKFLKKGFLDEPNSKIDKNIEFYSVDYAVVQEHFGLEDIDLSKKFKKKRSK